MSKYMIYNNDEVTFILRPTLDDAKQWAIMYRDHSHEIIVREVRNTIDFTMQLIADRTRSLKDNITEYKTNKL